MTHARSTAYQTPIAVENAASDTMDGSQIEPDGIDIDASFDLSANKSTHDLATKREIRYWLEWQSRMISGVICGGIFLRTDPVDDTKLNEITWPQNTVDTVMLCKMAKDTLRTEKPVVRGNVADGSDVVDIVACPVRQHKMLVGAVVFTLTNRTESQRDSVQQLMQWCVVWLENLLESQSSSAEHASKFQMQALKFVTAIEPMAVSGYQLCSYLADEFECSVVALGLSQNLTVQALAVSNQLEFDRRTQRIGEIELAMEECADQDVTILLSPEHTEVSDITHAHSQMLKKNSELVVCSIPVRAEEGLVGVLMFVRAKGTLFSAEQRHNMDSLVAAIGPVLKLQTIVNQSLSEKVGHSCAGFYKRLVGRDNVKLKTFVGLLLLIPLLLVTVPAEQRVTAVASLEGTLQRAIVAPMDGYIKSVHARAGDTVMAGQPLVALDDSSLLLQFEKWSSKRDKLESEYQLAWANRDKAQVSIIAAQLTQLEAQLALVKSEMAHNNIIAPFDGLLISGDLSRLSGTPVEQGQLLFELVPLEGFKVSLTIDEYDVGKLEDGQRGVLRLTGSPNKPIDFTIQKAFPVASVKQNQSVFRVEAILQKPPDNLRPGMQGVGKISVGKSSIGSVWTQSLRERLKMSAWYFGF